MGRLTTHVLDTVQGKPAQGVTLDLHVLDSGGNWRPGGQIVTNADGRTDQPVLAGEQFKAGTYMLTFHIGDYFRRCGLAGAEQPFLDLVPVRFSIADADGHYHVPLLASPYSYSTYRGS